MVVEHTHHKCQDLWDWSSWSVLRLVHCSSSDWLYQVKLWKKHLVSLNPWINMTKHNVLRPSSATDPTWAKCQVPCQNCELGCKLGSWHFPRQRTKHSESARQPFPSFVPFLASSSCSLLWVWLLVHYNTTGYHSNYTCLSLFLCPMPTTETGDNSDKENLTSVTKADSNKPSIKEKLTATWPKDHSADTVLIDTLHKERDEGR